MRRLPNPLLAWLALPWRQQLIYLKRKVHDSIPGVSRIGSADRSLLEARLLVVYAADAELRTLLFIGCDWYTNDYVELFQPRRERFRTLDVDPEKARFGSAGHVVAPLQEVARHFAAGSVDVIICNGVYGFGIDDRVELGRALVASCQVLRPGGTLILGWNDVKALAPFDPAPVALESGFERSVNSPLGAWRVVTETPFRHTFDSYVRSS